MRFMPFFYVRVKSQKQKTKAKSEQMHGSHKITFETRPKYKRNGNYFAEKIVLAKFFSLYFL